MNIFVKSIYKANIGFDSNKTLNGDLDNGNNIKKR